MKNMKKIFVSVLLLATTLSAIEISEFSGDGRFYYGTDDTYHGELFDKKYARGNLL